MYFLSIVDDAYALAASVEDGEINEAVFRAARIAAIADEHARLEIADAAFNVIAALDSAANDDTAVLGSALMTLANIISEAIDERNCGVTSPIPNLVQLNRRANLRLILKELTSEDVKGIQAQAKALHIGLRFLEEMLTGGYIPETFAREVEWVMQKPDGWMDEDERERDL
jgi:hypothetical protein